MDYGCSTVGSTLALGARSHRFESYHPYLNELISNYYNMKKQVIYSLIESIRKTTNKSLDKLVQFLKDFE